MSFDPFLGMLGLRATGDVLPEEGIHLRFNYSKYAGYPPKGISLYRVPADLYKQNILPTVTIDSVEENVIPKFGAIELPIHVKIFQNHHLRNEKGFLITPMNKFKINLREGVRGFQFSFFSFGFSVEIEIELRDDQGIIKKVVEIPRISVRPFYFEHIKEIQSIEVKSYAILMLEINFYRRGWRSIAQADEIEHIIHLKLPGTQNEVNDRVEPMGISPGTIPIDGFKMISELLEINPNSSPIFQVKEYEDANSISEDKAIYRVNPHEILTTQSIHPYIARAAGLYYVDKINPNSEVRYLAGAHWKLQEEAEGYITYIVKNLFDTDPLPKPTGLNAYAINGDLKLLPTGQDKSGVVGIGLRWNLPERTPGIEQNHAARYLVRRKNADGEVEFEKDLIVGHSKNRDQFSKPEFQYLDFGDDETKNGLDGTFVYDIRGISLFEIVSQPVETDPINVDSFTIPPSPVYVQAIFDSNAPQILDLTFSWSANQYGKDPDVRLFNLYIDHRQLNPLIGEIRQAMFAPEAINLEIEPNRTTWDQGVTLDEGIMTFESVNYVIQEVLSRDPLKIKVARIPGIPLPTSMSCVVTPNWLDPEIWLKKIGSITFTPSPENALITNVTPVTNHPEMCEILLENTPFDIVAPIFTSDDFTGVSSVSVATILQNGIEYEVWSIPNSLDPDYNRKFRVGINFDEEEDDEGNVTIIKNSPIADIAQIFPKISVKITDFNLASVCSELDFRNRFALGVTAIDADFDGSNEGPVSTRVFIEWINPTPPEKQEFVAEPTMDSVEAERAGADGYSYYNLIWNRIPGASHYHVYRTDEKMLIATDSDRRVRAGLEPEDYASKTLYQLWELAGIDDHYLDDERVEGNQLAYSRLTSEPWEPVYNELNQVVFRDRTLPGHSSNRFFYRVQGISATGVLGELSDPFQPVHCPLARKPEKLAITRHKILLQDENAHIYLFWRNLPTPNLDYYLIYRTESEAIANQKNWRKFEHAVKVTREQFHRPLLVEYGIVDLSSIPGAKNCTPLGIFKWTDFQSTFGDIDIDFATANGSLQNYLSFDDDDNPESILGRLKVIALDENVQVISYFEIEGTEKCLKIFTGEKMYIETIDEPSVYYYSLASVDNNGNISDLSDPLKIDLLVPFSH